VGIRARAHLERTAKRHGIPLRAEHIHVKEGRPFEEICRLASKLEIDLIVIPTRGNTGLKHLILGSTAERIVRYSPCPVLVVHSAVGGSRAKRNGATPAAIKIKKILVPIDFSACSLKGLAYAAALARQFNASLILFNSVHVEYYLTNDEYGRYDLPEVIEESERASRRQMKELVEKTDWEGLKVQSLLESGHPGNRICQQALTQRADLIVTSTHGTTGLKHILLGSTAEYVVRTATVPVLVVPSHERPAV
jgi:nucleotide-binding universal stress UspA family protein